MYALRTLVALILCLIGICICGLDANSAETKQSRFTRTIYLVRHGAYDQAARIDPQIGGALTPLGIAEARLVAARLRGLPMHFDSITSSTMARALDTAAIIRESLPDQRFAESADLSECTPPAIHPPKDELPDEATACAKRLDHAFEERFRPATTVAQNDLIVAHGNVIRYFVMKALGVETKAWLGLSVAHCSLTVIQVSEKGVFRVLSVGDVGHLPANMLSWGTSTDPELKISPNHENTAQ